MAELIPLEYRMKGLMKAQISRWVSVGVIAALVASAAVGYAYMWDRQQTSHFDTLSTAYKQRSSLIDQSQQFIARRQELASRMGKMQELMDDKVLLSLLRNISSGFSGNNCLEFVSITAHNDAKAADGTEDPTAYSVRINGITESSMTLAELMTRLGKQSEPAMHVSLESSRREDIMDGQVMRFEILCEKPDGKDNTGT